MAVEHVIEAGDLHIFRLWKYLIGRQQKKAYEKVNLRKSEIKRNLNLPCDYILICYGHSRCSIEIVIFAQFIVPQRSLFSAPQRLLFIVPQRGKRKFLFVPRKILRNCIKPHSHPIGFYWGPQCSWTITSANSMQEHLEMLNRYLPVDNSLIWNYYMLVVSLRSSFVGRRRCVLLFEYGSVQMPFANYNYIHQNIPRLKQFKINQKNNHQT